MIALVQWIVFMALHLVVLGICAVGLLDALRRPAVAFTHAGKRTRGFWLAVLGAATALAFVAVPFRGGGLGNGTLFALLAAVAGIVYLVDVKPAIAPYSGRRGPRQDRW